MDREILFRGKRKDNGKWVDGSLWVYGESCAISTLNDFPFGPKWEDVDPATVGQYTGLTDKNGKRIFEGDIVGYKESGRIFYGVIRFEEYTISDNIEPNHFGIYIEWLNDMDLRNEIKFWLREYPIEVIGNIHENPDLLQ